MKRPARVDVVEAEMLFASAQGILRTGRPEDMKDGHRVLRAVSNHINAAIGYIPFARDVKTAYALETDPDSAWLSHTLLRGAAPTITEDRQVTAFWEKAEGLQCTINKFLVGQQPSPESLAKVRMFCRKVEVHCQELVKLLDQEALMLPQPQARLQPELRAFH